MTPREKAEHLFLKHYDFAEGDTNRDKIDSAIELSLITVDECINCTQYEKVLNDRNIPMWDECETTEYWLRVQVELNERSFLNAEDLPGFEGTMDKLNGL